MLVLGIESATPVASAALADEKGLLGEVLLNVGLTHAEQLLPLIDALFKQCRKTIRDVTAIGVSAGPGSFTGLRIGMATAKALAQGRTPTHTTPEGGGVQLFAIPTLEAMAWQMMGQQVFVSPMLNARREQIYAGLYRWGPGLPLAAGQAADRGSRGYAQVAGNSLIGEASADDRGKAVFDEGSGAYEALREVFISRQRGKKDRLIAGVGDGGWTLDTVIQAEAADPLHWAEKLRTQGQTIYLVGDGAAMYKEIWQQVLGSSAQILPPMCGLCRGSFIALATIDKLGKCGTVGDSRENSDRPNDYSMKPIYLRGI